MAKKHFIALADCMRGIKWTPEQLGAIMTFCKQFNPAFNRERWLSYLHGECGPNGGLVR
jgi:hypothetical protein